jgi:DNA-3-methyladenine glycosylase
MLTATRLPRAFYDRPTLQVARALLGKRILHIENGVPIGGIITETEAYCGEEDLGCHAKAGRTSRTAIMYGRSGHAYVYFTYGMHWLFNCVTRPEGTPEAVLIRAIEPTDGLDIMAHRRGRQPQRLWTDGPAKLTQALGIGSDHNGIDLTSQDSELFLQEALTVPDNRVTTSPRVGLYTVPEPWKSIPWRFQAELKGIDIIEEKNPLGGTYELA